MKKFYFSSFGLILLAVWFTFAFQAAAQNAVKASAEASFMVSPNIVISQFYGGGGNAATSQYTNDFVELFNRGTAPVNISGWSVQYASTGGTNWLPAAPLPNVTLQPGQYFLIQFTGGTMGGAPLPTPDFIAPIVMPEGFIPNLSATTGKLALVNTSTRLPASTCPVDPSIVDMVGYGDTASCFEGARTPNLSTTTAGKRNSNGCADTDNNNLDFTITAPVARNTSSPTNSCNLGGSLQAGGAANPNTVSPTGTTLLTVAVIPATSPPSTGITVVGNLTDIGGSASQTFFDDGSNGDATPGDNTFSFLATIPAGTTGGIHNVSATASDAQGRTANVNMNINVNAPLPGDDPLILGNPSGATTDTANENNYLMPKPQYTLSYNRSKATANWVAWRLDTTWIGDAERQDDFRPDPALPAGWYHVTDSDYSGSGYQRGHMTPSGDRTRSVPDNSATFLMTNIVPQIGQNNEGPWADFETYCRSLAAQGNEVYIISGPSGNIGTIAQGRIVVPAYTWKVALVLPNGNNDLQRINKATRTIAIIVPNFLPLNQSAPWRNFRTSVKAVEVMTGYNFFSNVGANTRQLIKQRRDTQ